MAFDAVGHRPILDDTRYDGDDTLVLAVSDPSSSAVLDTATETDATISDDDRVPFKGAVTDLTAVRAGRAEVAQSWRQGCGMLAIARATETDEVSVDAARLAAKVVPFMLRRPAVVRSGPPVSELSLSGDDVRIREWVAKAHERTAVEAIESPPGFVADCDAAPGALAFASTAEAAIEEMRSVLLGWASLRVERGHDLPVLPAQP